MSAAPIQTQDRQSQQASTPTAGPPAGGQQTSGMQSGPPPVPATKPVLSSPGAYMANFTSNTTTPTAGIHSVNKFKSKQRFYKHCIQQIKKKDTIILDYTTISFTTTYG